MIKVATDFSGVGSPETALKRLGIEHEVVFACDIDKYARMSYGVLHNPKQMFEDITTRPMEFPQLDLYVAGFPCQSFSIAGKRKGFECPTNGTLFHTLSEFIRINQPKCFILENVKGLVNHDNGRTFQIIKDKLSGSGGSINDQMFLTDIDGLGYHIHFKVLNTKNFGLPQNRERIFIVGFKDARAFSFPKKIELQYKLKDILQDNPNSKYYLSDSINEKFQSGEYKYSNEINQSINQDISTCIDASYFKGFGVRNGKCRQVISNIYIPVKEKYYLSENAIKSIIENTKNLQTSKVNPEISSTLQSPGNACGVYKGATFIKVHSTHTRSSNRPSVQNNKNAGGSGHLSKSDGLTYCLDTQNSQAVQWVADYRTDEGLRKRKDNISPCLTTAHNSDSCLSRMPPLIKQNRIRRLTPLECFRLQGFTDEEHSMCEEVQSDSQLYKQMGNTISVPVIQAILKNIYHA